MSDELQPPLSGIRVIDFTRVIAGPLCTQQLADLGAEVIKIENPTMGDEGRRMTEPGRGGRGYFFTAFNRSKQSVAIDIRKPGAKPIVDALIARSDIVIENFRPGVMARHGYDYAALRERHPRLVYVSISAYGQDGPMADRPGFDPVLQAESGMMALTGEPDGPPMRTPLSLIDTMTALQAVGAICAVLFARQRSGRGQHIDLALLDTAIHGLGNAALYYLSTGEVPERTGNSHMLATPTSLFETSTRPIYLALPTDRLFRQFCTDVLEQPELADDPRFSTAPDRTRNRRQLLELIQDVLETQSASHWLARMRHLPAGEVRPLDEALDSPEVRARDMVRTIEADDGERFEVLGSPLKLSESPLAPFRAPPELGEHTDAVLERLAGVSPEALAALRADGVIK
jgi:crotonobetainyl-CoA:carnitine CoA-transferase CaiB-like acyl-CoA transferase